MKKEYFFCMTILAMTSCGKAPNTNQHILSDPVGSLRIIVSGERLPFQVTADLTAMTEKKEVISFDDCGEERPTRLAQTDSK